MGAMAFWCSGGREPGDLSFRRAVARPKGGPELRLVVLQRLALYIAAAVLLAGFASSAAYCERVLVVTTQQNTAPVVASYCQGTYVFSDLTSAGLPFDVRLYGAFMTMDMSPYDVIILNGHTSPVPVAQVAQRCVDLQAAGKKIFINGNRPFKSYDVTGTIATEIVYTDRLFNAPKYKEYVVTGYPTLPAGLQKDPVISTIGLSNRYIWTFAPASPPPVEIRLAGKLIGFVGPTGGALWGNTEYEYNLLDYGKLVNYIRYGDALTVGFANDRTEGQPIVAFHVDCHIPSRASAVDALNNLSATYGIPLDNALTLSQLNSAGAAKWNSVTNPLIAVGSHTRTHPQNWPSVTDLWSETGQAIADTRSMIPRTLNFLAFSGSKNPTTAQLDQLFQWGVRFDGQGQECRRCPKPDGTYYEYQIMPVNSGWFRNMAACQSCPTWPSETLYSDNVVYNQYRHYDTVTAQLHAQNVKLGMYSYGYIHDDFVDVYSCWGYVDGIPMSTYIDSSMRWLRDQGVRFTFAHDLVSRLQDYIAGNIAYVANPDGSITVTVARPNRVANEIKVGFKGGLTPVADPGPSVVSQTLAGECAYIKLAQETTSTVRVRWVSLPPFPPVVKYASAYISTASVISWEEPTYPSGIAEYQYAVGTTPGATDAQGWISTGTATSGDLSQAQLQHGGTHYVSVRCRYASSGWSSPGISGPLVADMTPATTPVVLDAGHQQESTSYIYASWSSGDPESGVVEYRYCIGTAPGDNSVLDWTYTTDTSCNQNALTLVVGQTYYVTVKARNGLGLWSAQGASDGILIVPALHMTVGVARYEAEGTHVVLEGVVVTAAFNYWFYVESPDQSAGLKVMSASKPSVGDILDIDGYMYADEIERMVDPVISITLVGSGGVEPVYMTNLALGGANNPIIPGPTGGTGLNNIGLLVKVSGKILSTGTYHIVIDDGSKVPYVGTQKGVRIAVTAPHSFTTGSQVMVTGISGLYQDGLYLRRMIFTRSNSDVQVLSP